MDPAAFKDCLTCLVSDDPPYNPISIFEMSSVDTTNIQATLTVAMGSPSESAVVDVLADIAYKKTHVLYKSEKGNKSFFFSRCLLLPFLMLFPLALQCKFGSISLAFFQKHTLVQMYYALSSDSCHSLPLVTIEMVCL